MFLVKEIIHFYTQFVNTCCQKIDVKLLIYKFINKILISIDQNDELINNSQGLTIAFLDKVSFFVPMCTKGVL